MSVSQSQPREGERKHDAIRIQKWPSNERIRHARRHYASLIEYKDNIPEFFRGCVLCVRGNALHERRRCTPPWLQGFQSYTKQKESGRTKSLGQLRKKRKRGEFSFFRSVPRRRRHRRTLGRCIRSAGCIDVVDAPLFKGSKRERDGRKEENGKGRGKGAC